MKRREFLRPVAGGTLAAFLPSRAFGQEAIPHSEKVPETPFDAPEGSWTLAVFPDSQNLTKQLPEVFIRQAEWVAAHKQSHNIRFVAQLGDITDNNLPEQWENAKKAMDVLKKAGVAYSVLPGNHDLGEGGKCLDRTTLMNDYFKPEDYANSASVTYFEAGKMENTAHTFTTPQGEILLLALEFGPRDAVVEWAGQVISRNPQHTVIITTHVYLYSDDTRYDFPKYGKEQTWNPNTYGVAKLEPVNDGEALWNKLAGKHPNVRFTLNGHVLHDGAGRLSTKGSGGQMVHQLLSNYQKDVKPNRPFQGGGFFRLMQFLPDKKTVRVKTYSPWLDEWLTDEQQQFELVI